MRRIALLGLLLLLPACQTLGGNPFDGIGGFFGDTASYRLNPNQPVGDAPNLLRVMGKPVEQPALTPEPGDVWPGPVAPEPTLQDIERQQNQMGNPEAPPTGRPMPRGKAIAVLSTSPRPPAWPAWPTLHALH